MTLLGKSFTAVILLLSLAFMVLALVANATHRNWRDVVLGPGGLKERIETVETTNRELRDARQRTQATLNRERAARRTALAELQTQLDELDSQLSQAQAENRNLQEENTELSQVDLARAKDLESLRQETERLRNQIRDERQERDQLFAQTLELTDQMNTLKGMVQIQEERNEQLTAQVTRYKEVVDAKGIDINEPLDGAPPARNGNVLVVNRPRELVEVSIGHDDGLRQGHLLDVTRDGRYVTRLRVRNTDPDRAVAEILRDYSEAAIREGDRVFTSLD